MDRDKQQFVDSYLASPDRYMHSPYLNDPEVVDAIMSPGPDILANTLGDDILKHVANYAKLGATDTDMAEFFNVTTATLRRWSKFYPRFKDAMQSGKDFADAKVEQSLFQRAIGWSHPDVHISNYMGVITKTDITKHYPGDVKAQLAWLYNRKREDWQDKRTVDHTLTLMTPDERKLKIIEYQKKLTHNEPITITQQSEPVE